MRITLATLGSRGDVQPMVVLGIELQRRGHEVVMGVPPNLVAFAQRAGFAAHPIGPDSRAFVESPDGQRWLASGNVRAFLAAMGEVGHQMAAKADAELLRACAGAEMIVCGILGEDHALCVAEASGIPVVSLHLAPARPTRAYPNYLVTTRSLPGGLNRATGALVERIVWRTVGSDTNALRSQLGLRAFTRSTPARMAAAGILELQGYSAVLAPGLDYGPRRPLVGFLTPDAGLRARLGEGEVAPELDAWLDDGDPPAYFGFGSMPVLDPEATLSMISRVSARLGLRALVSAGWSDISGDAAGEGHVRIVGAVNHDAVLPRCRLAVHHGGAGTTAAALSAGIPSFVCSVFADQLFWGARLEQLGCGVHRRFAKIDPAVLESGLVRVLDPAVARRARCFGAALRSEVGAAVRATDAIERWTGSAPHRATNVGATAR